MVNTVAYGMTGTMERSTERVGGRKVAKRLGARDWEIAALQMIGEAGLKGLAIEPLARRLGVTKGSFYWHFSRPEELLKASLARWERVFTDGKYGALEETLDPAERLRTLFGDVASGDPALGVFLAFSLERDHPLVGPVLRRVMKKRIRFLERALGDLGLPVSAAGDRAVVLYSIYVGFLQVSAQLSPAGLSARRRRGLVEQAFQLLLPEAGAD